MTQEEKAKAYDEAIKKAKALYGSSEPMSGCSVILETIFPELAESEDEKIRKEIISALKFANVKGVYNKHLAWLEKQCNTPKEVTCTQEVEVGNGNIKALVTEKIPIDKVEPKFKAGNWYQCTKDFFGKGVTFDKNTAYYCSKEGCLQDEYGCHIAIVKDLYDNFKLWTIQDAKDGDVLATSAGAFIYNGDRGGDSCPGSYCGINTLGNFQTGVKTHWTGKKVYPATKEQRDLLFQKMKEAGYEWLEETKELKKIHIIDEGKDEMDYCFTKMMNGEKVSSAWSEEDDNVLKDIKKAVIDYYGLKTQDIILGWLKSLKQRIGG